MTKRLAIITLRVTTTLGPLPAHVMKASRAMAANVKVGSLVLDIIIVIIFPVCL